MLPHGKLVTKRILERLIEKNYNKLDPQYCYKLSSSHVICSGNEWQQEGSRITLRNSFKSDFNHFPEQSHIEECVQIINGGFDVLSSRYGLNDKKWISN